jgi:hypothetical protein
MIKNVESIGMEDEEFVALFRVLQQPWIGNKDEEEENEKL